MSTTKSILASSLILSSAFATPVYKQLIKRDPSGPAFSDVFADPCFIQTNDSTPYWAFATQVDDTMVPIASSSDFQTWTYTGNDALAGLPSWATAPVWAPDVFYISSGSQAGTYNMYYAPQANENATHCLGLARSSNGVGGPYADGSSESWICPQGEGGAIDPAAFVDSDGTRYIVYKIDGDHVNSLSTPIMIQQVEEDGYTLVGGPQQIFDNMGAGSPDYGNVEAPALVKAADTYYLFFSHGTTYNSTYAESVVTSSSITGPYENRQDLLTTGDYELLSPGGMDVNNAGGKAVFHNGTSPDRTLFTAQLSFNNGQVTVS